jgi:transcriptional regulator with XRE-family HTH domain
MPDRFLKLVHADLGMKRLEGFYQKNLARKLRISKPLLSQYLRGDVEMPTQIRTKLIQVLSLEDAVEKLGIRFNDL